MKFTVYFTMVSNQDYINPEVHVVEQATIIVADNKDEALVKFYDTFKNDMDSNVIRIKEIQVR